MKGGNFMEHTDNTIKAVYYGNFDNNYYEFYKKYKHCVNYLNGHSLTFDARLKKLNKLHDLLNKWCNYDLELVKLTVNCIDYKLYKECYQNIRPYIKSFKLLLLKEISTLNNEIYKSFIYTEYLVPSDDLEKLYLEISKEHRI